MGNPKPHVVQGSAAFELSFEYMYSGHLGMLGLDTELYELEMQAILRQTHSPVFPGVLEVYIG